ncbi:UbiX family flavin prenyltransferase [Stappia sp. TSB10GB4]|uniref:UbiX family flavin prenyltransferase n=1 Tax=Stappia sp. TSB10GB4 TaxID=2003584 RepID=UPI00164660DB|nr:UbiX family flavin prenyltransferase [Stappia sp. TSB10GB4]
MTRVVLGVSGASGAMLALACARHLARRGASIDLVVSAGGERTFALEDGLAARAELSALAAREHAIGDIGAQIASGSCPVAGMIVAPCSMRSLSAIAHGLDDNLLTRAASVQLKERRPLVLLAREAPLSLVHLRNMVLATEAGAIILPPVPAFYLQPASLADAVAEIAARAVDLLRLGPAEARRWQPAGPHM